MPRLSLIYIGLGLGTAGSALGLAWLLSVELLPAERTAPRADEGASEVAPVAAPREYVGVVIPSEAADITARGEGRVEDMKVRLGDTVAPNQVLARLDERALRDLVAVAQATLQAVRADEDKARFELAEAQDRKRRWEETARASDLVVSTDEMARVSYAEKYANQRLKVAQAATAEKQAVVSDLERKRSEMVVRAPFGGRVAARYVDPGATVSAGSRIVRLVSSEGLWVRFAVPEEESGSVKLGMHIETHSENGGALYGVIEKIAPEVDAAARMIFVEARLSVSTEEVASSLAGRVVRVRTEVSSAAVLERRRGGR